MSGPGDGARASRAEVPETTAAVACPSGVMRDRRVTRHSETPILGAFVPALS